MARILSGIVLVLASLLGPVAAAAYEEGRDYVRISPSQPTQAPAGKFEVVEFFWYGCPHCFRFEPIVNQWAAAKPADIEFRRVPAVFNDIWATHARTYYAAQELGVLDKIHKPLFDAIHVQRRQLFSQDTVTAFVGELGVDKAKFAAAYKSVSVEGKVRQALALLRGSAITGVPCMVVNGKYRVSAAAPGDGRSEEDTQREMLKVVEFLVDKERKESGARR
ncbi:MAG: thiol:disulfide interchange protein DsbA/DsbL [Gammaproteobacteria bacterium]